jgi:hypothetical protein
MGVGGMAHTGCGKDSRIKLEADLRREKCWFFFNDVTARLDPCPSHVMNYEFFRSLSKPCSSKNQYPKAKIGRLKSLHHFACSTNTAVP